jgi:bifunctional enzyme CysN/CysC/sulfate adenylyltransferase subunit 1
MSVTLQLEDQIDLSRGDMLVSPQQPPRLSRNFQAMVVWLHATPLELGSSYLLKHTARQTRVRPVKIHHRVNVNTLAHESATQLQMNDIALLEFEANVPLFLDPYSSNRTTGSLILIDPLSNATVGAAMVQADAPPSATKTHEPQFISMHSTHTPVASHERYARHGHSPALILLENRPALAARLDRLLFENSFESLHLTAADVAPSTLPDVLRVARAAGMIAIYSGDTLSAETRHAITSESSDQTTDHAFVAAADRRGRSSTFAPETDSQDDELLRQALAFAQSLRLASKQPGKVN